MPEDTITIQTLESKNSAEAGKSVGQSANEIRDAFEIKKGRHANSCQCERCKANRAKRTAKAVPLSSPEVDTTFVKQSVESVLTAGDAVLTQKIYRTAFRLTDDKALSIDLAKDAGLTVQECDCYGTLCQRIAQKYKFAGKYFEEGCLIVLTIGWVTRIFLVFKKLGEYANLRNRIAGPANRQTKTETQPEA